MSLISKSLHKFILPCFAVVFGLTFADIPAEIPKCLAGDTDCIAKTITNILHRYPKGNPDFGLQSVDKLTLHDIVISEARGDSPVQLNLKFNTMNIYGFERTNVTRTVGFERDPLKTKIEVYATVPDILITGDYETTGKVLLLPLSGKGDAEIKIKNLKIGVKVKLAVERRDDKQYVTLSKVKSTLEPEHVYIDLQNLFAGNKELEETMHRLLNEHWKDIWSELSGGIKNAVSEIVQILMVNVLRELSYDDFYKKA